MSCTNCGSTDGSCGSNGSCGGNSAGHGKLPVFDWLSNMRLPQGQSAFNCVEVRFKNDRKHYYKNVNELPLSIGETVAVEARSGHDVGVITLTGELVRIQMRKKNIPVDSEEVKKLYRKATQKDIDAWQAAREKEQATMIEARKIARNLGLEMKISDVEYQGDGHKAIFYYTAEGRVDFRELIKRYAAAFSIRIEMRQIGFRQEAAKIGGIGTSGRELCCSTWLTDFRSVSTSAARYQQLSINPQKLTGQCGKLKCCLNFELDSYLDALEDFPSMDTGFNTEKGRAECIKIDVFKKELWFAYRENGVTWYKFSLDRINEFVDRSEKGETLPALEELAKEEITVQKDYVDVVEENSLERFERKRKKRSRKRKPGKPGDKRQPSGRKNDRGKRPKGDKPYGKRKSSGKKNSKHKPNHNPSGKKDENQ